MTDEETRLGVGEIEYVADMLRAISWSKDELSGVSSASLDELVHSLAISEAALRRTAAEMKAATKG